MTGLVLLLATVLLRGVHGNRHVRARLLFSACAFGAGALLALLLRYHLAPADIDEPIRLLLPLLLLLGAINAVVALAINPWRTHSLPDRFPTIVQDTIVIALFAAGAALLLRERLLATTAVGAAIIGFALQDTLGNLFAGLAIQIEKPFRVGHWVRLGATDGLVSEITWRATKVRTKNGNFVIVPNSALARDTIVNYSEPSVETRIDTDVGASYDVAPNEVKATILAAIQHEPLLSRTIPAEVFIAEFGASAIVYRICTWTAEFAVDERLRDRVRAAVYYAFRRKGIAIPYPIQTEIHRDDPPPAEPNRAAIAATLAQVAIFSALATDERAALARAATRSLFGAGEVVVKQGDEGRSMFVLERGGAVVTVGPSDHEVARVAPVGFFGEMSLLTGDPRNATVRTTVDSELLEISVDAFRAFVLANPAAVEQIGHAVAVRRAERDRHAASGAAVPVETPQTLVARIRGFLGLSSS
ncbi:MAG: mechanosensitive ion channel domain-containing protein [Acidobacteriota bacterium]